MILWQAKLDDYEAEKLTNEDCDELCDKLQDFWDALIREKLCDIELKEREEQNASSIS